MMDLDMQVNNTSSTPGVRRTPGVLIIFLLLITTSLAHARGGYGVIHIPIETTEALKKDDIAAAIRNLRLVATSEQSKYLLRQMEEIKTYEMDKSKLKKKEYLRILNVGIAYNNLFLFVKSQGETSNKLFNKTLKFFKKANKASSPFMKNRIKLLTASLYASTGDLKKAETYFKKVALSTFKNEFQRNTNLAHYYSAIGNTLQAMTHLEMAYKERPKFVKLWLGISDDFENIDETEEYQSFIKKHRIKRLNRGRLVFTG